MSASPAGEQRGEAPANSAGAGPDLGEGIEGVRLRTTLDNLAARGAPRLRALDDERVAGAWTATIEELLDPRSPLRNSIDRNVANAMHLSAPGLQAALEAVGRPLLGEALHLVFARARARAPTERAAPALVVLPANLPGLALQSLLPALARRRPALYKSPSVEPWLTPAVLRAAARHEPALGDAYAAMVWRGGASPLERIALDRCDPVIAYGDQPALDDLAKRARGRVVGLGPAFSIALLHREPTDVEVAGLARDVALADQRGCLSVHAALTMGDAGGLARRLAVALATLSVELPPGPPDLAVAAATRQVVDDASARGLPVHGSLERGAAVVGAPGEVAPSPGHRLARVVAVRDSYEALALLEPWRGRLQGAVLLSGAPLSLAAGLVGLGVSRIAAPGELQLAGPEWRNGDVDLLEVF